MKKTILLLFVCFLVLHVEKTWAQAAARALPEATLTLAQAVSQAEAENPDLQRLKAIADRLSWAKLEALSGYLPHITAGYDHFVSSSYMRENIVFGGAVVNFPAAYPQDNITFDASWTFFDGLESWHKYKAAQLDADSATLELTRAKFKVEEAVRSAFYQALASQKLFDVAKENVSTLEDHLRRANVTEKAGYGTRFDVLRIEATLEEARAELQEAQSTLENKRDMLSEVMGLEKNEERPLAGDLPVLNENDIPRNLDLSVSEREDYQAQVKRQEASQHLKSASGAFWLPSVSVFAEEQYYQFGNFDPAIQANAGFQNGSFVGLRLRWNIFDGGYSYAKEKEASATTYESESETRKILIQMPREFDMWKRNFYQSVLLYKARSRALSQFEESVRLAGVGIKAGTRTHTEMLDAELDLFRARAGVVKAQADAIEALGRLELALGRKIWTGKTN